MGSKTNGDWTLDDVAAWFTRQVPSDWLVDSPRLVADRDELLVTLPIQSKPLSEARSPDAEVAEGSDTAIDGEDGSEALAIAEFREATREQRVAIALRAEAMWARKVSWAVSCGDSVRTFSNASVPVMTRLRIAERRVLDTLIESGVAKSRSEALAWCVKLVDRHEAEWLAKLRDAMADVEKVRGEGPA